MMTLKRTGPKDGQRPQHIWKGQMMTQKRTGPNDGQRPRLKTGATYTEQLTGESNAAALNNTSARKKPNDTEDAWGV